MKLMVTDSQRCVGCQLCMFACSRRQGEVGLSEACLGVRSIGGMEKGFSVIICRACPDPPCARVCPNQALTPRQDGGVRFNPDQCIGCRNCQKACLIGAVYWDDDTQKPEICIHCGYCARFCPHGVLKLVDGEGAVK